MYEEHPMTKKTISVSELSQWMEQTKDMVLIDVRTAGEFRRGHVPSALNLHGEALRRYLHTVPSQTTVAVICQSGGRSQLACKVMSGDFQRLVNVEGGTSAWIRAGLPIEKENNTMNASTETKLRRQTHFVAAIMLTTALTMGFTGHPEWFYLACLPAFGLMLDAITGVCPMTLILRKAPWNAGCS